MKSLIIDNYDSFTYNLVQMVAEVNGCNPLVVKNDQYSWQELLQLEYDNIIISPGPGHPDIPSDFGICRKILLESPKPILGVCLGHQGLCSTYGGKVIHAREPMHGQISKIYHWHDELFSHVPSKFDAVRYHSLICNQQIPACLQVLAVTEDNLIMAMRHKHKPQWGVQFHPESICSEYGHQILANFKSLSKRNDGEKSKVFAIFQLQKNRFVPRELGSPPKEQQPYQVVVKKITRMPDAQQVFTALFSQEKFAVWLDSSKLVAGLSRFSFMGALGGPLSYRVKYSVSENETTIIKNDRFTIQSIDIFTFLKQEIDHYSDLSTTLPFNFNCGFIGYFGYELKSITSPVNNAHKSEFADAEFLFIDRFIAFDHEKKEGYLLSLCEKNNQHMAYEWFAEVEQKLSGLQGEVNDRSITVIADVTPHVRHPECNEGSQNVSKTYQIQEIPHFARDDVRGELPADLNENYSILRNYSTYMSDIHECMKHIRNGDSYEVCLTNKIKFNHSADPLLYYLSLRAINPAPYAAFLKFDEIAVACSSIERFLWIDPFGNVESKPIKGTLPRGRSLQDDEDLVNLLTSDEKFRAENRMVVDLLRNDLGLVCKVGSVHVPKLMAVETYATVHQLVSTVRGELLPHFSAIDCIKACFPGDQ